jgi:membrane-associated phospholipid phosphatase
MGRRHFVSQDIWVAIPTKLSTESDLSCPPIPGKLSVLDALLKHIIRRPRPIYAAAFLHSYSFSFPSGHAMGSLIGYGMLAYLLVSFWANRWQVRIPNVSAAVC